MANDTKKTAKDAPKAAETSRQTATKGGESGEAEVQAKMDEINAQGFMGEETDQTPNQNYTVSGVTQGKPTPETDAQAKKDAANPSKK